MKLLVVEDDAQLCAQVSATLEQAGFVVDRAHDGTQGEFLGSTERYAAVVLDLGLPGLGGVEVLQRWRAACTASPAQLRAVNPLVIPRNHRVEAALAAASDDGDLAPLEARLAALREPFAERDTPFAAPAPAAQTARYRTFCGT